jgi:hypothetical protein
VARRGKLGNAPGSDVHLTPPEIWERLDRIAPAWFDPCPHPYEEDGLASVWPDAPTYVNPPFSDLEPWAEKVCREAWARFANRDGTRKWAPMVALVPVRPSQPYFGRLLMLCNAVALWTGDKDQGGTLGRRVRFLDAAGKRQAGAPFDTAIFYFGSAPRATFMAAFRDVAKVVRPLEVL